MGSTVPVPRGRSSWWGYHYRLTSLTTEPAPRGPTTARTPSQTAFLVTHGSVGLDAEGGSAGDVGRDYLAGFDTTTGGNSGGIREPVPQPARAAGTVTLRHEVVKPKRGVQLITIYPLSD